MHLEDQYFDKAQYVQIRCSWYLLIMHADSEAQKITGPMLQLHISHIKIQAIERLKKVTGLFEF